MKTLIVVSCLSAVVIINTQVMGQQQGQGGETCPPDFLDYLSDHGRCLRLIKTSMTWHEARDKCLELSSDLVTVDSQSMADALGLLTRKHGMKTYWIGLNDILVNNDYYWNDGTPLTWSYWGYWGSLMAGWQQPNDGSHNDNCVIGDHRSEMRVKDQWQDKGCSTTHGFICQSKPGNAIKMRNFKERQDLSTSPINMEVTGTALAGSVARCAVLCLHQTVCDGFFYLEGTCDFLKLKDKAATSPKGRVFIAAVTG